jgi:hypothetical protein
MRSHCCQCIPPIVARERLGKNPLAVARQRLDKHVTAVTNTHGTVDLIVGRVVFNLVRVSYQGKWAD